MVFLKRFSARDLIFYLLAILVMVFTLNAVQQMNEPDDPTYNEIRLLFEQEKVESVTFPDEHTLELHLREKVKSLGDTDTVRYRIYDFAISMKISTI